MNFLNNLINSRQTIIEMLELRGFNCTKYRNFTNEELEIMLKNIDKKMSYNMMSLDMLCEHNTMDNKILVKYSLLSKIKETSIESLITDLIEYDVIKDNDHVIIISKDNINNEEQLDNLFRNFYKTNKIFVQVFSIERIVKNILKHELVPKLRILSETEKEQIKTKYDVDNYSQFPLILKLDPMAKMYGVNNGDMCEIIRKSDSAGNYISYRYCE